MKKKGKKLIVSGAVLAIVAIAGSVYGFSHFNLKTAYAQTSTVQSNANSVVKESVAKQPENGKTQENEINDGQGGHQDQSGNIDHQFNGIE